MHINCANYKFVVCIACISPNSESKKKKKKHSDAVSIKHNKCLHRDQSINRCRQPIKILKDKLIYTAQTINQSDA